MVAVMDGKYQIREVWRHNLREEFGRIIEVVRHYPYVSMVRDPRCRRRGRPLLTYSSFLRQDTEFPGTVARPVGNFNRSTTEYTYQLLRCNVDLLKVGSFFPWRSAYVVSSCLT